MAASGGDGVSKMAASGGHHPPPPPPLPSDAADVLASLEALTTLLKDRRGGGYSHFLPKGPNSPPEGPNSPPAGPNSPPEGPNSPPAGPNSPPEGPNSPPEGPNSPPAGPNPSPDDLAALGLLLQALEEGRPQWGQSPYIPALHGDRKAPFDPSGGAASPPSPPPTSDDEPPDEGGAGGVGSCVSNTACALFLSAVVALGATTAIAIPIAAPFLGRKRREAPLLQEATELLLPLLEEAEERERRRPPADDSSRRTRT